MNTVLVINELDALSSYLQYVVPLIHNSNNFGCSIKGQGTVRIKGYLNQITSHPSAS